MISVGIDVSKEKSTVCILKPYGEIVSKPFEVYHVEQELSELATMLLRLNDEVRIIMEATGIYHLPVLSYFKEKGFFVAVINPFEMKEYRCQGLRRVKTDKQDAIAISHYGIDHWYRLKEYKAQENIYTELKLLGRQYCHYMRMRVESVLELTHLLDYTMPGIKTLLQGWNEKNGKDKLGDFAEEYWHYDNITKKSEKQFIDSYLKWAKKKGYHQNQDKAIKIYALAKEGIPTVSSNTPSTKMLVQEAVRVLREVDHTLMTILTQMRSLAKSLPEYPIVRAVGLSNICYTLLNKFLQDSLWGFPTQRSHREQIIVPTVIDLELPGKVLKGIKGMGGIKPLVILPVAAFHFPVMTGCERTDQFMTDYMLL